MAGWFAAGYVWRKELPDLAGELRKLRRRGRRQTVTEQRRMLDILSSAYGIPLRKRERPKES